MMMRYGVRMAVGGVFLAGALALAVSCQPKTEAPGDAGTAVSPDSARRAAMLELGHKAFLANCAMCHGEWGAGDGPLAAALIEKGQAVPARLNDRSRFDEIGRPRLIQIIREGGGHTGRSNLMPPWGDKLDHQTIENVADFVLTIPDLKPETPPAVIADFMRAPEGLAGDGRKLFVFYCTTCHGPNAKGDGPFADSLYARNQIRPRDLSDSLYFAGKTDQDLYVAVAMGGAHIGKSSFMPTWAVTLPPEQIKDLVAYIRAISRTGGAH